MMMLANHCILTNHNDHGQGGRGGHRGGVQSGRGDKATGCEDQVEQKRLSSLKIFPAQRLLILFLMQGMILPTLTKHLALFAGLQV